jgi:alkylated DNA repair dioxygenase AlkB
MIPKMPSDFRSIPIEKGELKWSPDFYPSDQADALLQKLSEEIAWRQEPIKIFGREMMQPRLTAWHGDPGTAYSYSGITMEPLPWTPLLQEIKTKIESVADHAFNSVLLNLYRDGQDSMGWHSDDEPELGKNPVIASLSLGAARRFHLKPKKRKDLENLRFDLTHGSLLIMGGALQHHWLHQISKTKRAVGVRVNLTFRWVMGNKGKA